MAAMAPTCNIFGCSFLHEPRFYTKHILSQCVFLLYFEQKRLVHPRTAIPLIGLEYEGWLMFHLPCTVHHKSSALLCVTWFGIGRFTHILHGYFNGTWANIWWPQSSAAFLKNMGICIAGIYYDLGPISIYNCSHTGIGLSIINIRRYHGHLISIIEPPIATSHYKDKTVSRPSYLYNGKSHT